MPRKSSTFQLLDKVTDGKLGERVKALRAEGLSWEATARQLHAEFGITVTRETLRNWDKAEPEQASA